MRAFFSRRKICWLFVFFLTIRTHSYSMQQQSLCTAASLVDDAGQRDCLIHDQNNVDCVTASCIDIEKKLCAIVAKFDPSVDIASLQTIEALLQYRSFDGKTILHIAVACAKTIDDIAVLKEIIQRDKELLFEIDDNLQSCIWYCSEPIILHFLLQEMEKISVQQCRATTNGLNIHGSNFLQHLIALRNIPTIDTNKIFICIRCFIEHGYEIGVPKRELLAQAAARATKDQEVLFLCDRIMFIRQCIGENYTVGKVDNALSLHFSKQPAFINYMRTMLSGCPKEKHFVRAIIEKAYPLSEPSCERYVLFLKMLIGYADNAIIPLAFIVKGTTLLHAAVFHNDIEMVSLLLKKGFDVNSIDRLQNTPLHIALLKNRIASAKVLITLANMQSKNISGSSCYDIIVKRYPELLANCPALLPLPSGQTAAGIVQEEQQGAFLVLDMYKRIAYMSYNNAMQCLYESIAVGNQAACRSIMVEIAPYQDTTAPTMPLISLIVKKNCQDVGNVNHIKILKKFLSLQALSNKLFLESLSEKDNPFFIAIEYANKGLIEDMVACDQDIIHFCAGPSYTSAIDYAVNAYLKSHTIEALGIVQVLLELGSDDTTMTQQRSKDDRLREIFEPYQFESFVTAVRLYLGAPSVVDFIREPIAELCAFSQCNTHSIVELSWSSQRMIVICALYYMDLLLTIDRDFCLEQASEEVFLCTMLIANKMHNDCFDKKFIQNNFPELSKEYIKELHTLKFEILKRLLMCSKCYDETEPQIGDASKCMYGLHPSAQQLNRFFIDRIYNRSIEKVII